MVEHALSWIWSGNQRPSKCGIERTGVRLFLSLFLLAICGQAESESEPQAFVAKNSILASAWYADGKIIVDWRFFQPTKAELGRLTASHNQTPIGKFASAPYPFPGARTAILAMLALDPGSDRRVVAQDKIALINIAGVIKSHHDFGIGAGTSTLGILRPLSPEHLHNLIAAVGPDAVRLDTERLIHESLRLLMEIPAQRRALLLFVPNGADVSLNSAQIISAAGMSKASIYILTSTAKASPDLQRIASETGGQLVSPELRSGFLSDPFRFLDSGGRAEIALPELTRKYWEDPAPVVVSLESGEEQVLLRVQTPVAAMGLFASLWTFAFEHTIMVSTLALLLSSLLFAFIYLRPEQCNSVWRNILLTWIQQKSPAQDRHAGQLEDISNGQCYVLHAAETSIGRSNANTVVLDDDTVSRVHTVIKRTEDGTLTIENRSETNPTQVNHLIIERATLVDGDLIVVGHKTLRVSLRT